MTAIKVITIGKIKDRRLSGLCQDYLDRMSKLSRISVKIIAWKDYAAEKLVEKIKEYREGHREEKLILLDENGKHYSTRALHSFLVQEEEQNITFFIAGAFGFPDEVKNMVSEHLSLSHLTFTHEMTSYLLLEQLYRVASLIEGLPYHKK